MLTRWWRRQRPASGPARVRRGVVAGILLVLGLQYGLERSAVADWIVAPLILQDTSGPADAIVVAGAGLVGPCMPNVSAVRRVMLATELWREGQAPIVIFTGGAPADLSCPVAEVMAELARQLGLPADRILLETTSQNTYENAVHVAPLLEALGAKRVRLVTDRLHLRRAVAALQGRGFAVERSGVPVYATHSGNRDMLKGGLREYAALAYYDMRGWLAQRGTTVAAAAAPPPTMNVRQADMQTQTIRFPAGPVVILGASYAEGWTPTTIAGRPVANKGVTGQQTFELLERFDRDVVALSPRAVVVWGFINDVFRTPADGVDAALDRARGSYLKMIERARAAGIEPVLATEVTITGRNEWRERIMAIVGPWLGKQSYQTRINQHVSAMNEWIRQTARAEGLLLLDFQRVMADPNGERRREFAQDDGSHLTAAAYGAMTTYALPLLEQRLGPPR